MVAINFYLITTMTFADASGVYSGTSEERTLWGRAFIMSSLGRLSSFGGSCFCACAASVTAAWSACPSVRPENAVAYSAVDEDQGIRLKRLHSRVMQRNTSETANTNYSGLPAVTFLRLTHSEAPEGTQRLSTTFSPCWSETQQAALQQLQNVRRGQFPRTRIGIELAMYYRPP